MNCTAGSMVKNLCILFIILTLMAGGCATSESEGRDNENSSGEEPDCSEPGDPRCPQDTDTDTDTTISDLPGTYNLTGFELTETSTGSYANQNDTESWCGTVVITSEGMIYLQHYFNEQTMELTWQIIEISKNTLLLSADDCQEWLDFSFDGENLSLMWPESQCFNDTIAVDYYLNRTGSSETYPTSSCTPIYPGGDGSDSDSIVPDLVGTYEMLSYEMTSEDTGTTIEGSEPDDTWAGSLLLSDSNTIDLRIEVEDEGYRSLWSITDVYDSDNDGEDDALTIVDDENCESASYFVYLPEDSLLGLGFPASTCTDYVEMIYTFHKTSDTVSSLQNSNGEESSVTISDLPAYLGVARYLDQMDADVSLNANRNQTLLTAPDSDSKKLMESLYTNSNQMNIKGSQSQNKKVFKILSD